MGVHVEEEWRYKRKSERASKSAFAYKINQKKKQQYKGKARGEKKGSREVIIKFTKELNQGRVFVTQLSILAEIIS